MSTIVFFLISVVVFAFAICIYIWREQTAYDRMKAELRDLDHQVEYLTKRQTELSERVNQVGISCEQSESNINYAIRSLDEKITVREMNPERLVKLHQPIQVMIAEKPKVKTVKPKPRAKK